MRTWDQFYPDVLPEVLGCPEPTVDRHLLRASRRFFSESLVWRVDLDPIITTGRIEHDIPFPVGADSARLMGATLDGRDIALDAMDTSTAGQRQRGDSGPARVLMMKKRSIELLPTQAAARKLVLTMCLQPSFDATGVPEEYSDDYYEAIADGALSTLLAMSKVPWGNAGVSQLKARAFEDAIGEAKTAAWRGHSNKRPRIRGQYF